RTHNGGWLGGLFDAPVMGSLWVLSCASVAESSGWAYQNWGIMGGPTRLSQLCAFPESIHPYPVSHTGAIRPIHAPPHRHPALAADFFERATQPQQIRTPLRRGNAARRASIEIDEPGMPVRI